MAESNTLKDKLKREQSRVTAEDWQYVYLHREGNFFRAFNQSAWLMATYVYAEDYRLKLGDKQGLQVMHMQTKASGDYAMAGFPIRSLEKYVGCSVMEEHDDIVRVTVDPLLLPKLSPEEYQKQYEAYVSAIPVKEQKPAKASTPTVAACGQSTGSHGVGMFDIIKQIMAFPIEESNPLEAMNFVAKLKTQVGRLL